MDLDGKWVTSDDNGKTIKVADGDTVFVRLRENSTTGYQWDFDNLDKKRVQVERAGFERATEAIGSGGEAMWTVKPQTPGTSKVRMKLWREWEGEPSIVDRFSFTLKVEQKHKRLGDQPKSRESAE